MSNIEHRMPNTEVQESALACIHLWFSVFRRPFSVFRLTEGDLENDLSSRPKRSRAEEPELEELGAMRQPNGGFIQFISMLTSPSALTQSKETVIF